MKIIKKFLLVLIALIFITPFIYIEINKLIYKNRVMDYLVDEKGYNKEEIKEIKGVWGFKLPPFYSTVTFNDEPTIEYIYFAHNEVLQFKYYSLNGKPIEDPYNLKHYEP